MTLTFEPPLDSTPTANIALVGPPKTGKTAGAASAPGPILYVNADLPGRMRYARQKFGDEHVRTVSFKGEATLNDIVWAVNSGDYKTVVLDPIHEVYRILLEERFGGKPPETMNNPALSKIRVVQDLLVSFCRSLCEAEEVNTVLVFHEARVEDDDSKEVERLPDAGPGKPKVGRLILGMVDVIGYTMVKEREGQLHYIAQLAPLNGRNGGDGFNCLLDEGKIARELDLTEWLERIKEASNAKA